jgi:uncharacterized membrane protein YqjE
MPDPVEKTKDVAAAVVHPAETAKDLAHEAEEGRSARTPAIALTGVTLVIAGAVAVMTIALLIVYFAVK